MSLLYQISDQPESVAIIPELVMLRVRLGKKSRGCAGMAEAFVAAHYDWPFVKENYAIFSTEISARDKERQIKGVSDQPQIQGWISDTVRGFFYQLKY